MLLVPAALAENAIVVYFSATGTTQQIADGIAAQTGADLFAIETVVPYTDDDLNWRDPDSRVCVEYEAGEAPVELVSVEVPGWEEYDTVYIGYPIWWQDASWVMDGFVTANDFTGKTVIPFCTSQASGYGESGERLAAKAGTGNWIVGGNFFGEATDEEIGSLRAEHAAADAVLHADLSRQGKGFQEPDAGARAGRTHPDPAAVPTDGTDDSSGGSSVSEEIVAKSVSE